MAPLGAATNNKLTKLGNHGAQPHVACVAGVERGERGEVECEREARSLSAPYRAPNDRASHSHSTSPLPPLSTPATQAKQHAFTAKFASFLTKFLNKSADNGKWGRFFHYNNKLERV